MGLPNYGQVGTAGMQAALYNARKRRRSRQDSGRATVNVTGDLVEGETLTATFNDNDPDGAASGITYMWLRDPSDVIDGETADTYLLTSDDIGARIKVRVEYTDPNGNVTVIHSEPSAVVVAAP